MPKAGTDLSNYDITYNQGTLTVTAAPLTITAHDQSKAYGEAFAFTGPEFDTMGLQEGDAVTSVALSSDGAAEDAELGTYPIVASDAVGTGLENYDIRYIDGTLTVTGELVPLLADTDVSVRQEAERQLVSGRARARVVPALVDFLNRDDIDDDARSAAGKALGVQGYVAVRNADGSWETVPAQRNGGDAARERPKN